MPLEVVASGVLWVWFLLVPPGAGHADQLSEDLAQLRTPQSLRYAVNGNLQVVDQRVDVRGRGAFIQPDRLQLSMEAAGQQIDQIVIGQTIYMRTSEAPDWQKTDLGQGGRGAIPPPSQTSVPPGAEKVIMEALRGFRLVGSETLRGAPTRHYRGDIDILSLAEALSGDANRRLLREALASFKLTLDYWVGTNDHYLHQLNMAMDIRSSARGLELPEQVSAELGIALSDFDQPVRIEAPIGQTPPSADPTPVLPPRAAPAQLPPSGRMPARLPNTGEGEAVAGLAGIFFAAVVLLGLGMLRKRSRAA